MSARAPFFPSAKSPPESRSAFTPDQTNPLHLISQKPSGPAVTSTDTNSSKKTSTLTLGELDAIKNSHLNSRRQTSGLGGIVKKNANAGISGPIANNISRPGTADPYSRHFQNNLHPQDPQPPVLAPTPKKLNGLSSSSLLSRNSTGSASFSSASHVFKVPSLDMSGLSDTIAAKKAHILASDGRTNATELTTTLSGRKSSEKFDYQTTGISNKDGPGRVLIEANTLDDMNETMPSFRMQDHELTVDGRIKSSSRSRKRLRDEYDQDGDGYMYQNTVKRHKYQDNAENETERPHSVLSHRRHRHDEPTHEGSLMDETTQNRHEFGSQSPAISQTHLNHGVHTPPQQFRSKGDPNALKRLLGQDPNVYIQDHIEAYEGWVHKWTNCSMEEWIAGADEISAQYHELLDYVKDFVDSKLKLCRNIHSNIDKHSDLLHKRNGVLDAAKKKLIAESGSVLGK